MHLPMILMSFFALVVIVSPSPVIGAAPADSSTAIGRVFEKTPDVVMDAVMIMGDVGPSTVMFDLGSGDGKMVLAAAALGATAVGIELREDLNEQARRLSEERQLSHLASFRSEDFFTADLSSATLVVL